MSIIVFSHITRLQTHEQRDRDQYFLDYSHMNVTISTTLSIFQQCLLMKTDQEN